MKLTVRARDRQEKILVFRMGQLGDMIVALPAMWAVRESWPNAHLTLLCDVHPNQKYVLARDIFEGAGLFDSLELYEVPGEQDGFLRRLSLKLKLLRRLRLQAFETLVYLAPTIRSARQIRRDRRFFRAAGVRRFYGMNGFKDIPRKKPGLPLRSLGREAELLLSRLENDGITVPEANQGSLSMGLGVIEENTVNQWRDRLSSDGGRKWVGVGAASKMPAKQWPKERFAEVIHGLIEEFDAWPIVFGGPEDRELAEELLASWGRGYCAAGYLGVRAAASALRRCGLYLGNDSGTMHLAAVAGTPCVAIFSSRDWPGAWYPYGVKQRVFRSEIECEGCYLVECVERRNECLKRISVDVVHEACRAMLVQHLEAAGSPPVV